ncbi:hypothetical protein DFP95_107239 [Cohnella lupini]|uniref:Uncharacterized protein n=1 Tax=Cohnella lupini TaxID=1294267 RepID=A0A3D9ICM9_9BACL|nr:hypothetical protein DFP95_107239 [Cohnella lupini]
METNKLRLMLLVEKPMQMLTFIHKIMACTNYVEILKDVDHLMCCHIGWITIVKNEGTIIFGNMINSPPNDTSNNNEGSGDNNGEVPYENNRFNLTVPNRNHYPDVMASKRKNRNRN